MNLANKKTKEVYCRTSCSYLSTVWNDERYNVTKPMKTHAFINDDIIKTHRSKNQTKATAKLLNS